MCIAIACKPGCDVMNFEVNLIFLIKLFFLYDQKAKTKNFGILRTKRDFKVRESTLVVFYRWNIIEIIA